LRKRSERREQAYANSYHKNERNDTFFHMKVPRILKVGTI